MTNPSEKDLGQPHGILRNASPYAQQQRETIISLNDSEKTVENEEDEDEDNEHSEGGTYEDAISGRWGEGPSRVNVVNAEKDFKNLERQLTRRSSIYRTQTGEKVLGDNGDFDLTNYLQDIIPRADDAGIKRRNLGVVWENLEVLGEGVGAQYIKTFADPFIGLSNLINPYFWAKKAFSKQSSQPKSITKTILHPMNGYCKDGEMILVLGRPGAGCSTLLRVLANDRKNYKEVSGEVTYGPFTAHEIALHHRGEVLYNQEDDFHYPTLTVRQTLTTALKTKTPGKRLPEQSHKKQFVDEFLDVLTKMYGLTKQIETVVGNAFIRGVSGGERKRLSIAEQMATRSSVNMWDGSTRGLDASSALDYVKSLRVMTNLMKKATMVSIYQASENIYDLFDKVILLYEGRCIYFGPANEARQYFINLGFECPSRQTTADFLTAVTDPHERKPRPGFEGRVPNTPKQFEDAFRASSFYTTVEKNRIEYQTSVSEHIPAAHFKEATKQVKQKHVSVKNPYTISFAGQVKVLTVRQIQLTRGDMTSVVSRYASNVIKAIIVGSVFFKLHTDGNGAFTRGGVLFFALLFNALISQAELPSALQGRPILYKHKGFAMYRPSAFAIAQIVVDIPLIIAQVVLFSVVLYFMSGLQLEAGKFFFFCLVLFLAAFCMTAFFRMWAAVSSTFDAASRNSGLLLLALILYSGYMIPYQSMHPWFVWIFWINPLAYAFKALISNEMRGLQFDCSGYTMIPSGPSYNDVQYQVCSLAGSKPGMTYVDGSDYLYAAYRYKTADMWWDVLAVFLFWLLFVAITCLALEKIEFGKGGFSTNVFKKGSVTINNKPQDEESGLASAGPLSASASTIEASNPATSGGRAKNSGIELEMAKGAVFAWENLDYVVPYKSDPSGKKQLLTNIAGLVKPGTMTALMGSSGAGKTTLLDVLAQRKNIGTVTGQIEVDGEPLRRDFQRTTGYCEQLDVHVPECTVREALRFSAYLRQPADVPEEEKNAYVEEIIHILEMENIADALIGTTESGLGISVEERKRLTIGVELVAKPKLLFLDEPTSGLDAQASYNIMRFMRKLTDQGQAILCTIHQPSSQLFAFFDDLLLLAKGGKTVFFGELGHDSSELIHYFEKNGAPKCAPDANPAEYILDVVNARHSGLDWPQIWASSPEKTKLLEDIKATRKTPAHTNNGTGQAVASSDEGLEFATDFRTQFKYVFRRMSRTYWRLPQYNFGRIFMMIVFALLNGFSFYKLGATKVDLQSRVFVIFQIMVMAALLVNMVEPRFHTERQWFYREFAGKYYGWKPFALSIILIEIPYIVLSATVFFLVFYWTVGFVSDSVLTFYTWLMITVFSLFAITLGQLIAALTPSTTVAALLNPFIFSSLNLFCGVMIPFAAMPKFWSSWIYWLDPYHYIIEGLVASQLHNVPVRCANDEYSIFNVPAGQTCGSYAATFLEKAMGYLNNPNDTSNCQYCQYEYGQDFYRNLNMDFDNRWRNLGILFIYIAFNVIMLMVAIRYVRWDRR
ncbi:ABC-2 type transporter-domain-containing protein [Lobosporangium transversale]|uniref:ABC-2 type transporter-domain-containing protein n=1 Tax=Lobosporangium transversale TaxID=64571 RepID=A0A1Y2H362_9FUNG|nr:ABC-2 type transporter-domain-containing protein [Lobosporangium transversale]ORZ28975.1 ABC-2 type transporter-domain-containing protein [Lobosporangium transversale]|eukprot:XP_021886648.1 ABC-2 type transporter-domain-containing protein [Lobosporangium transversale]